MFAEKWMAEKQISGLQKQNRRDADLDRDVLFLPRAADAKHRVAAGLQLTHHIDRLLQVPRRISGDLDEDIVLLESRLRGWTVLDGVDDLDFLGLVVELQLHADKPGGAFEFRSRLVAFEQERAVLVEILVAKHERPFLDSI